MLLVFRDFLLKAKDIRWFRQCMFSLSHSFFLQPNFICADHESMIVKEIHIIGTYISSTPLLNSGFMGTNDG